MDESLYGYNVSEINKLGESIKSVAESCCTIIQSKFQERLFDKMATAWYAEYAKQYFDKVKTSVDGIAPKVETLFNNFIEKVNGTGTDWNKVSGNTYSINIEKVSGLSTEVTNDVKVSTTGDETGNIGLNEQAVQDVIEDLPTMKSDIETAIAELNSNFVATAAFLGDEQAAEIAGFFADVTEAVDDIFDNLISGSNSVTTALETFKDNYKTSAQNVATSYREATVTKSSDSSN